MTLSQFVRGAIERRLAVIERSLVAIEGLAWSRRGDAIHVRGRQLVRRSIEDARLRFAGFDR
jgi:hypothetical protein